MATFWELKLDFKFDVFKKNTHNGKDSEKEVFFHGEILHVIPL